MTKNLLFAIMVANEIYHFLANASEKKLVINYKGERVIVTKKDGEGHYEIKIGSYLIRSNYGGSVNAISVSVFSGEDCIYTRGTKLIELLGNIL